MGVAAVVAALPPRPRRAPTPRGPPVRTERPRAAPLPLPGTVTLLALPLGSAVRVAVFPEPARTVPHHGVCVMVIGVDVLAVPLLLPPAAPSLGAPKLPEMGEMRGLACLDVSDPPHAGRISRRANGRTWSAARLVGEGFSSAWMRCRNIT